MAESENMGQNVNDVLADQIQEIVNTDEKLLEDATSIIERREQAGLSGLVGDLACVIINTEPERQQAAVGELLRYTGLDWAGGFRNDHYQTCVLRTAGSADLLIQARVDAHNPFEAGNTFPKSRHIPNTRLETLVFETTDIDKYVSIQKGLGVAFITSDIVRSDNFSFIQTVPSKLTGNSTGFIQWHGQRGDYAPCDSRGLNWALTKPTHPHLKNIGVLDHIATRVPAADRDAAILEFMALTNYDFAFAIYIETLNSITNVALMPAATFAMVFTSGIRPFVSAEASGPTERFMYNYGPRAHHLAFHTEQIVDTSVDLKADGLGFICDLIGSPEEGLRQAFSKPSEHTLLVNEYILRYGGFEGFFTKSNVTLLTDATNKQ